MTNAQCESLESNFLGQELLPSSFPCRRTLEIYLQSCKEVCHSEPQWLKAGDLLRPEFSVGDVLEKLIPTLAGYPDEEACVFNDKAQVTAFNTAFHKLARNMCTGSQEHELYAEGRSNGYVLQLSVLAIPVDRSFPLHAHANHEITICLAGECRELRSLATLCPDDLHRVRILGVSEVGPHETGPGGPMVQELKSKTVFADRGAGGCFADGIYASALGGGKPVANVNHPGSVHLSYSSPDHGALLFLLWAGAHANIQPCNFKQTTGIELLAKHVTPEFCEGCPALRAV